MWYGVVFALALFFFDERSINEVFMIGTTLEIESNMAYVKVMLVGLLLVLSLQFNSKGLLPEVPYRPPHPEKEAEEQ